MPCVLALAVSLCPFPNGSQGATNKAKPNTKPKPKPNTKPKPKPSHERKFSQELPAEKLDQIRCKLS